MRTAALAVVLLAALVTTSCSSDGSAGDEPTGDEIKAVAWSPCDDLTAERVSEIVGERVTEQNGTTAEPRCAFTPETEGGAAYDVNYLLFTGGLDAALDAMGAAGTQLRPVSVPGANAARLAVRAKDSGLLVTGFVETDGLVQSVNAAQLAPYDEAQVVAGTKALLAELAQQAPTSPSG